MMKPEAYTFGLLPETRQRINVYAFSVELFEDEANALKDFIRSHGPEVPFSELKAVDADLYETIRQALVAVAGEDETELQWPDDIVMDYFPEYYD